MAGTIVQGAVSTEEQLPDERVIDMSDRIRRAHPDDAQLTTMTDRLGSSQAVREKVTWLEEDDFPRVVTSVGAQLAGDTSITLTAGQGKIVSPNDILRNMRSNEAVRVVSVATDVVTVARGVGNVAAAAVNASDVWLDTADAQPQGSDFPTAHYLQRVLGFNYTQITRTTWTFTGTDTAIELYGGREPGKEAVRKSRERKVKWEHTGFFGARSFASAVPPDNDPRGTAGGLDEFIVTFRRDVNGPLTPAFFDQFLSDVMAYGSEDKVLFCSPLVAQSMSAWNRTGMGSQWQPTPQDVHGVKVNAFISGAYGYNVPVVVKKQWSQFPIANKAFGSWAFLVDMQNIRQRPMRDRDTKLILDQQTKGKDVYSAEYMREATFEINQEATHGILFGVTP